MPAAIPSRRALIPAEAPAGLSQAARQALPDTLSENTKRVYRSALQGLNERLAGRCVCDEHLSEVLAEMSAQGLSESTLRVAVAAVTKEVELAGASRGYAASPQQPLSTETVNGEVPDYDGGVLRIGGADPRSRRATSANQSLSCA